MQTVFSTEAYLQILKKIIINHHTLNYSSELSAIDTFSNVLPWLRRRYFLSILHTLEIRSLQNSGKSDSVIHLIIVYPAVDLVLVSW